MARISHVYTSGESRSKKELISVTLLMILKQSGWISRFDALFRFCVLPLISTTECSLFTVSPIISQNFKVELRNHDLQCYSVVVDMLTGNDNG